MPGAFPGIPLASHPRMLSFALRFARGLPIAGAICAAVLALPPAPSLATEVQVMVRLPNQGVSHIQGLGLVMGLPGTGDSAKEMAIAQPLLEIHRNNGNPLPSADELRSSKSVALVMVTCKIGESGARPGDNFDCTVAVIGGASSLKGGVLLMAPLRGPLPGQGVYGFAAGPVELQDDETETVARVLRGVTMSRPIDTSGVDNSFDLTIVPAYASWQAADVIARTINQEIWGRPDADQPPVAVATSDRTIRIVIPPGEQGARAAFIGEVLAINVNEDLLNLPPTITCNRRTGIITVSGDVRISTTGLTTPNLVITTTQPPPEPTPDNPVVRSSTWAALQANTPEPTGSNIMELLRAFDQLAISPQEQIDAIVQLEKSGRLHGRLIIE